MVHLTLANMDSVSALGLGGGSYGSQICETDAFALLDAFADAGGNLIDTAHIYGAWAVQGVNGGYGNSEVTIGHWMKQRGCREQMIIATKGGHPDFETGESRLNEKHIQQQLQESLDHLGTDYIDLYFLHRDDRNIPVAEILSWLQDAVEDGTIRALACSNWRSDRFFEARNVALHYGLPLLVTNQIGWNLAKPNRILTHDKFGEQVAMDDISRVAYCEGQVPIIAYHAQAGGLFSLLDQNEMKTVESSEFPKANLVQSYGNPVTWRRYQLAKKIGRRHGQPTNQIALAWLLQQSFPTFALIGPRTPDQLEDSLSALEIKLSPEEVAMLQNANAIADTEE